MRRTSIASMTTYKIKYLKKVVRLAEGSSFGELALIMAKPRAATVKAVTVTDLAILNKEQFTNIVGKVEEAQINKRLDLLEMVPFFHDFSRSLKTKITYHVKERFYSKNQVVYKEGNEDHNIYFIIRGEFEVSKRVYVQNSSALAHKSISLKV
jgi:CRP-like cAMP-binding protein